MILEFLLGLGGIGFGVHKYKKYKEKKQNKGVINAKKKPSKLRKFFFNDEIPIKRSVFQIMKDYNYKMNHGDENEDVKEETTPENQEENSSEKIVTEPKTTEEIKNEQEVAEEKKAFRNEAGSQLVNVLKNIKQQKEQEENKNIKPQNNQEDNKMINTTKEVTPGTFPIKGDPTMVYNTSFINNKVLENNPIYNDASQEMKEVATTNTSTPVINKKEDTLKETVKNEIEELKKIYISELGLPTDIEYTCPIILPVGGFQCYSKAYQNKKYALNINVNKKSEKTI